MAKATSIRRKHSDKFPLTLHPTGQYCKKIRGRMFYFGTDRRKALDRYHQEASTLHSGNARQLASTGSGINVRTLCNLYLQHAESRVAAGEIKLRQFNDQIALLKDFVGFIGPARLVYEVSTIDLQDYRGKLVKEGKAPKTINNRIGAFKAMYHWALENEVIKSAPNLKAVKKLPLRRQERPIFTVEQIHTLIQGARPKLRAMILLGLNCGFGCTDCAELKWANLDLESARVDLARGKTGIQRSLALWPETVEALGQVPRSGELVFYTRNGRPWVTSMRVQLRDGKEKYLKRNTVSEEFAKLLKKTGVKREKGVGFYTLRRTAATLAARSGDPLAVQRLLGHSDLKMASTYVQNVSEQTDRVVNDVRQFIIRDDS